MKADKIYAGRKVKKKRSANSLSSKSPYLLLAAILFITILLYLPSLKGHILHWDDNDYISDNAAIHKLDAQHIKNIFTSFYAFNYHPLTTLNWAVEYSLVAEKSSLLYHFDNLLLHLLNVVLVFWLFKLISKNNYVALLVALFHAVHPMHVESVAWITERKDLLYSFFFLLSLITYVRFTNENKAPPDRKFYFASLAFFLLSLFSKSAAVTLPLCLLLLDYLNKRKLTARILIEKIPFFALSILFGILALKSQTKAINDILHYSFFQNMLIVNHTVIRYLFMAIFPVGLSAFHPWPQLVNNNLPSIYFISPIITVLIIAGVIFSLKKTRVVVFGILFFIVGLLLVLQFIPIGEAVMAERYSYIPYLGLFYIMASLIVRIYENAGNKRDYLKPAIIILLLIITGGYIYASGNRVKVWLTDTNLWDDMINQYPTTAYKAYYNRSKLRQETNDVKGAYDDLSKLIEWKEYYKAALAMRGQIKSDSGNYAGAMNDFNLAVADDSTYYLGLNNRAATEMKMNKLTDALNDLNRSIQNKDDYYLSWFNRGAVKINLNNYQSAIDDFDKAISLKPDYCPAYFGKGVAYANAESKEKAIAAYSDAVNCNPQYVEAYNNRGDVKKQLNDTVGAIEDFTKSVEVNPNFSLGYRNLGDLNYKRGDKAGACADWQKGAQLGNEECRVNVGNFCK